MLRSAVVVASLGSLAAPVRAELIEFAFTGRVGTIFGAPTAPWNGAVIGDAMSIRYTFDSQTPDTFVMHPIIPPETIGEYPAILDYSVAIGALSLPPVAPGLITVWNNVDVTMHGEFEDLYGADGLFPGGVRAHPYLNDFDFPPDGVASDALPTDLTIGAWSIASLAVGLAPPGGGGWDILASIDTFERRVVPAPSGAAVLLCGLGVVGAVGRRRRGGGV